jgi:hypothetical protein
MQSRATEQPLRPPPRDEDGTSSTQSGRGKYAQQRSRLNESGLNLEGIAAPWFKFDLVRVYEELSQRNDEQTEQELLSQVATPPH